MPLALAWTPLSSGELNLGGGEKSHHCIHTGISGMLVSFRVSLNYVFQFLDWVCGITYVMFVWLMAQNLKEVFSSYEHITLNDSEEVGGVASVPTQFGVSTSLT